MDIETLNKEEFDKLHPSMKDYLIAGTDLNSYGSDIVTEKNFSPCVVGLVTEAERLYDLRKNRLNSQQKHWGITHKNG